MRKAAGILMIIVGCTLPAISAYLYEMLGETANSISIPLGFVLLGLIIGSGVCAFKKRHWGLALAGAICALCVAVTLAITSLLTFPIPFSYYTHPDAALFGASILGIIFILMGILAVVFLTKRKYEFE